VAETDHTAHTSRITIVTRGTPQVLLPDRGAAAEDGLDAARAGRDQGPQRHRARAGAGEGARHRAERVEALRVSDIFRAKVVDTTHESFVFELTGASSKIDKYVDLMRGLGLVEVSRTGVLSLQRGVEVF
jgi:acetolactate synthase-1/3 small subunit